MHGGRPFIVLDSIPVPARTDPRYIDIRCSSLPSLTSSHSLPLVVDHGMYLLLLTLIVLSSLAAQKSFLGIASGRSAMALAFLVRVSAPVDSKRKHRCELR